MSKDLSGNGWMGRGLIHAAPMSAATISAEKIGTSSIRTGTINAERISCDPISTARINAKPMVTLSTIPSTMRAAVYRGVNDVQVETVPVPLNSDGTLGRGDVVVAGDP